MVRAKFRVMELKQMWNGEMTVVRLLPVTAKATKESGHYIDPEASEENRQFWEATPSGEAELVFKGFDPIPGFAIGKCLIFKMEQLDVEPEEDAAKDYWKLESVKSSYSLDVAFHRSWKPEGLMSGTVKMDIHNEGAWSHFLGKHLTHWSISFEPAEG
jgi:hypothetical protein